MGPFTFLSLRGGKKISDHIQINGGYRLGRGPFLGLRIITDNLVFSFDFTQKGVSVDTSHSWQFGAPIKTTSKTNKDP